jgi:hypothetical protein
MDGNTDGTPVLLNLPTRHRQTFSQAIMEARELGSILMGGGNRP